MSGRLFLTSFLSAGSMQESDWIAIIFKPPSKGNKFSGILAYKYVAHFAYYVLFWTRISVSSSD